MSSRLLIAIDFDGTIVEHEFPEIGRPVPGAVEWIKTFQEMGAIIQLWTMRSDGQANGDVLTQAVDYCRRERIEFDHINHNPSQTSWTSSPKMYAHIYIDDAALGCPLINGSRMGSRPMANGRLVRGWSSNPEDDRTAW